MTILFFSSSPLLLPPVSLLCLFCKWHDKWSRFVQLLHFFGDWIISEPDGRRRERRMHFLSTCSHRWRKRMRNGLEERQWSSQYYYNGKESRFTIRWILLWKTTAMPLFSSYYCGGAGGSECRGGDGVLQNDEKGVSPSVTPLYCCTPGSGREGTTYSGDTIRVTDRAEQKFLS